MVPIVTQSDSARAVLAADATGAWVTYPSDGTVTRVEDGRITGRFTIAPGAGLIASTPGTLWVSYGDTAHNRYGLAKVDPRDGRILATVNLGDHRPNTLVPIGDTLWILGIDGNALLLRA